MSITTSPLIVVTTRRNEIQRTIDLPSRQRVSSSCWKTDKLNCGKSLSFMLWTSNRKERMSLTLSHCFSPLDACSWGKTTPPLKASPIHELSYMISSNTDSSTGGPQTAGVKPINSSLHIWQHHYAPETRRPPVHKVPMTNASSSSRPTIRSTRTHLMNSKSPFSISSSRFAFDIPILSSASSTGPLSKQQWTRGFPLIRSSLTCQATPIHKCTTTHHHSSIHQSLTSCICGIENATASAHKKVSLPSTLF